MPVPALLERDAPLQLLVQQLQVLRGASGRCVLLAGEAGVGKTSLLRAAQAQAPAALEWLNGLCEPLLSPPPWGPLLDWLDALPPSLAQLIARGRPAQEVMPEALAWLRRRSQPLVLCIDDLQWADGASLDLLRFLGRRIQDLPVLLLLAYRDDELGPEHPLHGVLAGLPSAACTRIALRPLSAAVVEQAVRAAGRAPQGVYRLTRGNPFLLHEWLASDPMALPATVREAVLARSRRLSAEARAGLEQLAVSPLPLERELLDALALRTACDEALGSGLLTEQGQGGAIGFRHELARQAFEDSLPPGRRRALHARLFEQLADAPAVRRLHHAEGAGLAAELLQLAPLAAAEAARAGDHREAARLLALALRQQPAAAGRAELLLQLAAQCELIYALEPARQALEQAIALFQQLDQPAALGQAQSRLARTLFLAGELQAGKQLAREAIQGLEALGRPSGLAMAYAVMAQLHLLDASQAAALHWGRRALAEAGNDTATRVHALNTVACAELAVADLPEAWARLDESLRTALAMGWPEAAARAYTNLLVHQIVHRHHLRWPALCEEALAYCAARDFDLYSLRLRLRRAHGWSETGRWAEAQADLQALLDGPLQLAAMDRQQAEHLLALLQLRRGGSGARAARAAHAYWDALLDGERRMQPWPWYAPVSVAALEAAWLLGRRDTLLRWAREQLAPSVAAGEPWRSGQIAVWLRRLGALDQLPEIPLAAPCEAELRGDLEAAAAAWAAAGNPYEQGLSLLGGDTDQLQRALALFERLGAEPAAALARRRLHEAGARGGLRGRGLATRADPLGLTARERRLLQELAGGDSYRTIAARWHRSPRTVENHARSLLAKLGLRGREEVAGFLALQPARAC